MEDKNMPNIASLMNAQYKVANAHLHKAFLIKGVIFVLNIFIIFLTSFENNGIIVWGVFGVSVLALILDNNYQAKFRSAYEIGEKIRKIDLVKRVFPNIHNRTEQAYLLTQIDAEVLAFARANPKPDSKYYTDREEKLEILAEHIQENSFWTSSLMGLYAKRIRKLIVIMFLVIIISAIVAMFLLDKYSNAIEGLSLNVSQYLALLVNTVFAFNILSYYTAFEKKSLQLKKIDEQLTVEKNSPTLEKLMISFAEYNSILYEAYPTPIVFTKSMVNI